MQVVETEELVRLPGAAPAAPKPLVETDRVRALLLNLTVGESV